MSTPNRPTDLACWNCGQSLEEIPRPISRHEHCPQCFEALHCCRLCRHWRPDDTISCDEERADPPVNKENANFCDWFRPAAGRFANARKESSEAAKNRLEGLFGTTAEESDTPVHDDERTDQPATDNPGAETSSGRPLSPAEAARAKLDSLFSADD